MPQQQKMKKGLPKRVMNARAKETRQRSWNRGQERKRIRRHAQSVAERRNLDLLSGHTWRTETQRRKLLKALQH